jgi:hypothetical protein
LRRPCGRKRSSLRRGRTDQHPSTTQRTYSRDRNYNRHNRQATRQGVKLQCAPHRCARESDRPRRTVPPVGSRRSNRQAHAPAHATKTHPTRLTSTSADREILNFRRMTAQETPLAAR